MSGEQERFIPAVTEGEIFLKQVYVAAENFKWPPLTEMDFSLDEQGLIVLPPCLHEGVGEGKKSD